MVGWLYPRKTLFIATKSTIFIENRTMRYNRSIKAQDGSGAQTPAADEFHIWRFCSAILRDKLEYGLARRLQQAADLGLGL